MEPPVQPASGSAGDPLHGRLLDDRYRLDATVARGGMATVYTATDTRLDRVVAVKVMHRALADDPDFVARFTQEARAAAGLASPEVVAVYDQGTDPGSGLAYLVMEHVRGGTLRDLVRDGGPQSPARALALVEPVLRALAAAHAAGVVHRDVKPENVLLADDGRVKVADFGLARAVERSTLTATTGLMLGTAAYMSPEQVDTGEAGPASDVYAVGVVLFELLTGVPPYGGDSHVRVAYRHVHEDVPPPGSLVEGVPPELDALVLRATRRDPAARPPDARAFLAELQALRGTLPDVRPDGAPGRSVPTQTPTLVVPRPPRREAPAGPVTPGPAARAPEGGTRRRGPLVALLVALAAVAALAGGWYLGLRQVPVPQVVALSAPAATERLKAAGFDVRVGDPAFSETVPDGAVAASDPQPGRRARTGSTVVLALSKGQDRRVLPNLVGRSQEDATTAVTRLGLRVGTVSRAYSDAPVGDVVAMGAPAGTRLRPGSPVNLTVSKGVELLDVPSVVGDDQRQAGEALQAAGFTSTVTEVFSEDVAKGTVVGQDPPGGQLGRGQAVALQVSKGPERITVPDLSGLTDAQAKAALAGAGLKGRGVTPPFFGGDRVSRQEPSAGSRVKRGATVSYLLT